MRVIICGGGGFIGQRLARYLLDKGYEVVILDRNQSRITSPKLQSFVVDLLDTKLFDGTWFSDVEAVINLSGKDILHLWTKEYMKAIWDSRVTVNKGGRASHRSSRAGIARGARPFRACSRSAGRVGSAIGRTLIFP